MKSARSVIENRKQENAEHRIAVSATTNSLAIVCFVSCLLPKYAVLLHAFLPSFSPSFSIPPQPHSLVYIPGNNFVLKTQHPVLIAGVATVGITLHVQLRRDVSGGVVKGVGLSPRKCSRVTSGVGVIVSQEECPCRVSGIHTSTRKTKVKM